MSNNIVQHPAAELIPVWESEGEHSVSGRALHNFLGLGRDYTTWFKKMTEYGFIEGQDFSPVRVKTIGAGRPSSDHALSLDMAKELAMIQRTERGKQARQYFIEVEKRARAMSAPRELSEQQIVLQALTILKANNEELEAKVERDAPKVEYVDTYVADSDLRLLRNVAKSIGVSESELRSDLIERKWIYAEHMTRWSESKQEKETITRYSPYSHKAQYFEPVPNHNAPRFKGEVMHTLKITPAGATAIGRLFGQNALMAVV